jgi:hypothetical protein
VSNFRIAALTAPGDIVKWYGAKTDIDDRKRTEAPLRSWLLFTWSSFYVLPTVSSSPTIGAFCPLESDPV